MSRPVFACSTMLRALRASPLRSFAHPPRPQLVQPNRVTFSSRRSIVQIPRQKGRFFQNAKILFAKHPYSVSLASIFILIGAGGLVYVNYVYFKYIVGQYHNYPEPVAKKLRRAVHYSNDQFDLDLALKYYKEAIIATQEEHMDPFSDEVLGIKLQIAHLLESAQRYKTAILVLDVIKRDCIRWVEDPNWGKKEGKEAQRRSVLEKAVRVSVRLGELYANEYVMEREKAEENLEWAVGAILKEKKRREDEGVKPGEGEWLNDDEIGAAFESLAFHYEEKNAHYLASPLFLQALTYCPNKTCHQVMLMNNLAASLMSQLHHALPYTPTDTSVPDPSSSAQPSKTSTPSSHFPKNPLNIAASWNLKASEVADTIPKSQWTEECDIALAAVAINNGSIAEAKGDLNTARQLYEEGLRIAKGVGYQEAVQLANQMLKEIGKGDGKGQKDRKRPAAALGIKWEDNKQQSKGVNEGS